MLTLRVITVASDRFVVFVRNQITDIFFSIPSIKRYLLVLIRAGPDRQTDRQTGR